MSNALSSDKQQQVLALGRPGFSLRQMRPCARSNGAALPSPSELDADGKGKALSILAHRIGRAVYFMLARKRAFDLARFLRS